MSERDVLEAFRNDLRRLRAKNFMGGMALQPRIPRDYSEHPELLTADLAFVVMAALCAASVAEVDLDVNGAVEAGKALYKRDILGDGPT